MSKRLTLLLIILIPVAAASAWLGSGRSARGKSQTPAGRGVEVSSPYAKVEEKASHLRGADEKPIRELADIVFHPEVPELRAAFVAPVEERFVRAEMEYRSTGSRGVAEADVVRLFDELARSLGAPTYARTSAEEVRGLRLTISRHAPHFIPRESADDKGVFTVDERMSPLEAAYVINQLLLQKRSNASFQLMAEERAYVRSGLQRLEDSGARLTDRERAGVHIALIQQMIDSGEPRRTPEELLAEIRTRAQEDGVLTPRLVGSTSARQREIEEVFERASSLSADEARSLAERMLGLLGV